jgi:phosphoribosylaminoimidazolecarboxamide formyltransferase/IMP cyclohydrolase
MIRRALISVSDKTGLLELAKALKGFQVEILSTGGTAKALEESGIEITSISDFTGFPEMMEGRLKTLHPRVHGALLGKRDDPKHQDDARTYGIQWIDLVVVNLYPFEQVAQSSLKPSWQDLIENIDIGGPAMIRAAAKNHQHVTVVVDPRDYRYIIKRLKKNPEDPFDLKFRYQLAAKAFRQTAIYDSVIASTLSHFEISEDHELSRTEYPRYHSIHGRLVQGLRYGENPHQKGALYKLTRPIEYKPLSDSLQGKELSFNNYLDADAAWKLLIELPEKSCVIIKHNNPCGVGRGQTEQEAYDRAFQADPESAFGGVVAISGTVHSELASKLAESFYEIVCAQAFGVGAREIFEKKKNLRLLLLPDLQSLQGSQVPHFDIRKLSGSYLVQDYDSLGKYSEFVLGPDVQCVTRRSPTDQERKALEFAWVVSKNLKSNAVVIANENQTLGIGVGAVNRKFASQFAMERASAFSSELRVCASDGFFPFSDNIEVLRSGGVSAIVQPGGSIRDPEVIEACNAANIAMLLTKSRHFRH